MCFIECVKDDCCYSLLARMVELCKAPVNEPQLPLLVVDHDLPSMQKCQAQIPSLLMHIDASFQGSAKRNLTLWGLTSRCMIPCEWQ